MMRLRTRFLPSLAAFGVLLLAGCSRKEAAAPTRDIAAEAEAYYRAHPDFFRFATPADLPKDLVWHDGHDVPEFDDPEAKQGGTDNDYIPDFPRTLRFIGPDANNPFRSYILDDMGLIARQPVTRQYIPAIAREWAFGKDGRTVYFRIDPEARYSDGVPVRADDFLFTFYFYRCPYTADPWYANYYTQNFSNITKYDDLTISISAPRPRLDLPDYLAIDPVPEHFYKDLGPDYVQRYQWRLQPTTGPYTILLPQDLHRGQSVDLTRVKSWWASEHRFYRHRFNFTRIHLEVIRDQDKALETFKRGGIDQFALSDQFGHDGPALWYQKLPNSDPLVRKGYIAKATFYNHIPRPPFGLYLNTAAPLLGDRNIRLGIAYSCNFDLVINKYFRGEYERLQTFSDDYPECPLHNLHPLPFSIAEADACFAKAGFVHRGPDGILVNAAGTRLSFAITASSAYPATQDVLTILKQEAAKAGLEFTLDILDQNTAFKKIEEKHHQIAYLEFETGGFYPRYWEFFDSANADKPDTNNLTNYADPVTDKLIDEYQRALTLPEVQRIAAEIEARIDDAVVFIPGVKVPFFRTAFWRWIQFPPDFDLPTDSGGDDNARQWEDVPSKAETLDAMTSGRSFPPDIRLYRAPVMD